MGKGGREGRSAWEGAYGKGRGTCGGPASCAPLSGECFRVWQGKYLSRGDAWEGGYGEGTYFKDSFFTISSSLQECHLNEERVPVQEAPPLDALTTRPRALPLPLSPPQHPLIPHPFRGFNSMKNEFLFEKRLTEHLPPIIAEFCNAKPTLVFCRSVDKTHIQGGGGGREWGEGRGKGGKPRGRWSGEGVCVCLLCHACVTR